MLGGTGGKEGRCVRYRGQKNAMAGWDRREGDHHSWCHLCWGRRAGTGRHSWYHLCCAGWKEGRCVRVRGSGERREGGV